MKTRWLLLLALAGAGAQAAGLDEDALWHKLRSGGVTVLMRHAATVPGIGDPPDFVLGQCATQRNLSEAGRRQARAIGAAFRQHGVNPGAVWSSRWCRCLDTARLAFGRVEPVAQLDSMFEEDNAARRARVAQTLARLEALPLAGMAGNLVLVTHDVNIRALADEAVAPGGVVVARMRGGALDVLGQLDLKPATPS
jgi:broad specificity phosphatase PhoE